jgi:proteasome lid subunit RPN8/RPN11
VIALAPAQVEAIREHGRAAYPEECCGALLGRAGEEACVVEDVRAIGNTHGDGRRRRFLVDPRDYLAVEREARLRGLDLLGFYHSHPDHPARPSAYDREHAWPNLVYLIVAVAGGTPAEMTCWRLSEDRAAMLPESISESISGSGRSS